MRNYLPAIIWSAVILILCLLPKSDLPSDGWFIDIPHFDKLVHVGLFAVFFATLFHANPKRGWQHVLICLALGGLVEILQEAMEAGRSAEWLDFFADAIGATFAALLALLVHGQRAALLVGS